MAASGASVSRIGQSIWRWTVSAGTTAAMGKTSRAAIRPWMAPETTFSSATNDTGSGASTRSSISRV
jgi:hypothetical protein